MALLTVTSPHLHKPVNTGAFMRQVIYATVPGIAIMTHFFGWATLINVVLAVLVAIGCETAVLKLRKKPIGFYLKDYSAVVTALLLAIAIPPTSPWWLTLIGVAFAIVKWVMLNHLGISNKHLSLAYVKIKKTGENHMVLLYMSYNFV